MILERRRAALATGVAFAATLPTAAAAHEAVAGWGGVLEGSRLPFHFPHVAFALAALAVAASVMRPAVRLTAALTFLAGALAAGLTPLLFIVQWLIPVLVLTALACGAVTAAAARAPRPVGELLAGLVGWGVGMATFPDHGTPAAAAATLTGTLGAALAAVGLVAAALALLRRALGGQVGGIAVRVAGAWVCAIAVLVLALTLVPLVRA